MIEELHIAMTNNQPKKQPKYDRKTFTKDVLGCLGVFGTIFGSVLLLVSLPTIFSAIFTESPKQKAERKVQELNDWFALGSSGSCEDKLKEQLRDPNSYERDKDFTTPTDNGNEKIITWEFRSKNGFGGLTNGIGMCAVSKKNGGTIKATILGQ